MDRSCTCDFEGCGNGIADDSALWRIKKATAELAVAFPNAELALSRLHQDPAMFECKRGGWTGGDCEQPLGTAGNAGDILVEFSDDNLEDLLEWVDYEDNYEGRADPSSSCSLCADCGDGCDKEIRPAGFTALAGGLYSVKGYLDGVMATDLHADSRPYVVILLSDDAGASCPGSADPQALALCAEGVPVYALGFSTLHVESLNRIAAEGCTSACSDRDRDGNPECSGTAIFIDKEDDLAEAIRPALGSPVEEICNGLDDDCDGNTDEEPLASSGSPCGSDDGVCEIGVTCCGQGEPGCCGTEDADEVCDCLDNDRDGLTDEDGVCVALVCEPLTQGFWKRQCDGPHASGEHERLPGYVDAFNDLATFGGVRDMAAMCDRLHPDPPNDKCEQAEAQLAALVLNVVSGRLAGECCASSEGTAGLVGDVVSEVDQLLATGGGGFDECARAQEIAASVNERRALCDASTPQQVPVDGGAAGNQDAAAPLSLTTSAGGLAPSAEPADGGAWDAGLHVPNTRGAGWGCQAAPVPAKDGVWIWVLLAIALCRVRCRRGTRASG